MHQSERNKVKQQIFIFFLNAIYQGCCLIDWVADSCWQNDSMAFCPAVYFFYTTCQVFPENSGQDQSG